MTVLLLVLVLNRTCSSVQSTEWHYVLYIKKHSHNTFTLEVSSHKTPGHLWLI